MPLTPDRTNRHQPSTKRAEVVSGRPAKAGTGGVIIYGDPHGEWGPLLRACEESRPDGVVILGDCDLEVPFRERLKPLFEAGVSVRWIAGNHDKDSEVWHDHLFENYPEGNLGSLTVCLGCIRIAGLGGVFKERIWYPRDQSAEPMFSDRVAYMRSLPRASRWRGGLPLKMRDAIFPDDVEKLGRLRADVLVTHEAPTSHPFGFVGIDKAAELCRARLIVHGHHHRRVRGVLATGVKVIGLAKAEVLWLRPEDLT